MCEVGQAIGLFWQLYRRLALHHVDRPCGSGAIRRAVLDEAHIVLQIGVALVHLQLILDVVIQFD